MHSLLFVLAIVLPLQALGHRPEDQSCTKTLVGFAPNNGGPLATPQTEFPAAKNRHVVLPHLREPEGKTVYRVEEGKTGSVKYAGGPRQLLTTFKLQSCTGVTIYDPVTKVGTISHMVTWTYRKQGVHFDTNVPPGDAGIDKARIDAYTEDVRKQFAAAGGDYSRAQVTVLWGNFDQKNDKGIVDALVGSLDVGKPARVQVDAQQSNGADRLDVRTRVMALNLEDGKVSDMIKRDDNGFWRDTDAHDTSLDKSHP